MTKYEELKKSLPPLNVEQVEAIAAFIARCDIEEHVPEDGYCCASDAVDKIPELAANALREAYGIKVKWDDEEDDEDE